MKPYLIIALISIVALAIVFRVGTLRKNILGVA